MSLAWFLSIFVGFPFYLSACGIALCWEMEKRRFFWLRLLLIPAYAVAFRFFIINFDIPMMPHVLIYICSVLILWCCFKIKVLYAFFFQSVAYLCEHILANIKKLFEYGFNAANVNNNVLLYSIALVIAVALLVAIRFTLTKRIVQLTHSGANYKLLYCTLIVSTLIFTIVISELLRLGDSLEPVLCCFRIVVCLALITLPFLIFKIINDRGEQQLLESILVQAEKQQEMSKENLEAINLRCHDLKHQISALLVMEGEEGRKELIHQLEKEVMIFDSFAKSGNTALDVLVTEKSLICEKLGIKFTYIIDGELLGFMDTVDLYTLLGNALDNAIESVKSLKEGQKIIFLKINGKGNLINVCVENYCDKTLEFEDGLPKTTKEDSSRHGFGLKSIRAIAQKYGGEFFIETADKSFVLNILFHNQK